MEIFRNNYEQQRVVDSFGLVEQEVISAIVADISGKIKNGTLYKGKAGENFRIYTCRLLECFALCGVFLEDKDIKIFKDFIEENIKNPQ
jgi:hypothetical protein